MNTSTGVRTLKQTQVGERVTVERIAGDGPLRQRILDMGLTRGAEVVVKKVAPFGDPIEVTVRGYELSLRRQEAAYIEVL